MTQPQPAPEEFHVCVAGGRAYRDAPQMARALDRLHAAKPITLLIHGAAPGADSLAGQWAQQRGVPVKTYPPSRKLDGPGRDWKFRRNTRMLLSSKPNLVVAFPGGPGTGHTARETVRLGPPLWDLRSGPDTAPLPSLASLEPAV